MCKWKQHNGGQNLTNHEADFLTSSSAFCLPPVFENGGRYCLGSVAVSAVSADVLPYISVAIKASFLKLGMCNICKNNIAKMFLHFEKF